MPSLRELRHQSGLTQAELAAKSGLRQATISALENGHAHPHNSTVGALAVALELAPDQIRASLNPSPDSAAIPDAIGQMAQGWPFLDGLDADLRTGLATALVAEWTHSSTALEGNTITLGDTLFVLTEGLTISGKSLREHQELHGHSQALGLMASWTRSLRPIGIEQLHQLHRAVQTGTTIDSLAPIGRWKVEPNGTNAITSAGSSEWHDYAQPQHVPALVEQWLKTLAIHCRNPLFKSRSPSDPPTRWQATEVAKENALDAYTDVHLGFTSIHPYAAGNGRMARLLANIPILRAGFPPLLVPLAERRRYLTLLGDYSLSRRQPHPGEPLIPNNAERSAIRGFLTNCWQSTHDLLARFHHRQSVR